MPVANELTRFKEDFPIISDVPIEDRSKGYEEAADVAGKASQLLGKQAESLAEDASSTMLLQSQGQLAELENSTKIMMLQHPDQAESIASKVDRNAEAIKSQAYVNKQDRNKLNYLVDRTMDGLQLDAAKQSTDITRESARYKISSTFQDNLDSVRRNLYKDPKAAEITIKAMYDTLRGGVATGVLTGDGAASLSKLLHEEIRRHEFITEGIKSGDMTAADYHATQAFTTQGTLNNADLPSNVSTQQLYDINSENMNAGDIKANYARWNNVNPIALANIKNDSTVSGLLNYRRGAALGYGLVHSGEGFPFIENEVKRLDSMKQLGDVEEGKRDSLSNYVNDIKNGNFLKYAMETKDGAQAAKDYRLQSIVIQNSHDSDEVKAANLQDARNKLTQSLINVGESLHIPDQYRNIFTPDVVNSVKSSLFDPQGDITTGLNAIFSTPKQSRAYLAASMGDPNKAMVVYTVGQLQGKADSGFFSNLLLTQKDGFDFKSLIQTKASGLLGTPRSDDYMRAKLAGDSNLKSIFELQKIYPDVKGVTPNIALVNMGVKYIKGMAVLRNDPEIKHFEDYKQEFVDNIARGFKPVKDSNFNIDANVIPLSNAQLSEVSSHVLRLGYRQQFDEGKTFAEIEEDHARNPYQVISTQTGRLVIVDSLGKKVIGKNGMALYDHIYSPNLIKEAHYSSGKPILPIGMVHPRKK